MGESAPVARFLFCSSCEAGVGKPVEENGNERVVSPAGEGLDNSLGGEVARRDDEGRLCALEGGDGFFQFVMNGECAADEAGGHAAGPEVFDGLDGPTAGFGMA